MSVKKAISFLVLRPAFNQKNLSTIAFVALAFGIYSFAGGGVSTAPPNVKMGETFGDIAESPYENANAASFSFGGGGSQVSLMEPVHNSVDRAEAEAIIGVKPSGDSSKRQRLVNRRGRLFDPDTDDSLEGREPLDRDGLVKGVDMKSHRDEWIMLRSEKRKQDTLAAIEDRLDVRRSRKKQPPVSTGEPQ